MGETGTRPRLRRAATPLLQRTSSAARRATTAHSPVCGGVRYDPNDTAHHGSVRRDGQRRHLRRRATRGTRTPPIPIPVSPRSRAVTVTTPLPGTPMATDYPMPDVAPAAAVAMATRCSGAGRRWVPASPAIPQRPVSGLDADAGSAASALSSHDLLEGREGNDRSGSTQGHDGSAAQYPEWANEGHAMPRRAQGPVWARIPEATAAVPRVPLGRLPHRRGGGQDPADRR